MSTPELTLFQAWLHERADIAEHFYGKLPVLHRSHDEEWIFETCFIIGDSALARRLPDIAITWLQRASDHLQSLHMMIKFPYYYDWDLVIRHSLGGWVDLVDDPD